MRVSDDKMAIILKGRGEKREKRGSELKTLKKKIEISSNPNLQRYPLLELLGFPCSHESVSHLVMSDSSGSRGL